MIYLDSSVVLAQLFAENRSPPAAMGENSLTSSRLLEYEVWNRIHAHGFTRSHARETAAFLERVTLINIAPRVLVRALEAFPIVVGTLDGLHLATIEFLRANGEAVELASYDRRLNDCAQALGIALYPV